MRDAVSSRIIVVALALLPLLIGMAGASAPPSGQGNDPEVQLRAAAAATFHRNVQLGVPVAYPSPAYYNPYLRDSFWTSEALGDRRFALDVLAKFAGALDQAGDPPTMFVNAYRRPVYHDDESAALLLIWSWRNATRYGVAPARALLQRVTDYLLRRAHTGSLITPAGRFGSWWDAYALPVPATWAYSQGLYAVALRCAQHLGLAVPGHDVARAEAAYRTLYDARLGYLRLNTALPASDASALTGEFLSLWLFHHTMLSDAVVFSTLRHLTPFGAGYRVVALPPGVEGEHGGYLRGDSAGEPGDYQNGASWLLYDTLSIGAAGLHGLPSALSHLRARLALEFRYGVVLHEYLTTNPALPYYGREPPARDYFSWDTFALVVDHVLHETRVATRR